LTSIIYLILIIYCFYNWRLSILLLQKKSIPLRHQNY
jgi:hypothetical protein